MTDLVTWLRDELQNAQLRAEALETMDGPEGWARLGRQDPAVAEELLRDVEAKRRILDWLDRLDFYESDSGLIRMPDTDDVRKLLALPYADRPGYRAEWAPE